VEAVRLGSTQSLIDAIDDARSIRLETYVLGNPRLVDSLERAAKRGADVEVSICGDPAGDKRLVRENVQMIKALQKNGVSVHVELGEGADSLHAKTAVVDDQLFLDDRNWTESPWETVLRLDAGANAGIVRTKQEALHSEAALIERASGKDLLFSTETLGPGPVADALLEKARAGGHVRVMYNADINIEGSADTVRRLRQAGVEIRDTHESRKITVAGDYAWIGSANATRGGPERDWGMIVQGELAQRLDAIAERTWDAAHPLMYGHP
jgi:hypothetical protein